MTSEIIIRLIADAAVIPVILIGAWALLFKVPKGHRFEAYCRILMAGLTAYLLAKFIGSIYQPASLRPFEILGVDAGAITCAVWFETRMKKVSLLLAGFVVLICIGRVLALVHTPLDVIGGVGIALVGALWYSNVPRKQEVHGHGKSNSKPATNHS